MAYRDREEPRSPPSHTTQHTGPYCAVRLIRQNQIQGNKRPSDAR
jgi:hypothetical protein